VSNRGHKVNRSAPRRAQVAAVQLRAARQGCLCTPTQRIVREGRELVVELHHKPLCPAPDFDSVLGRVQVQRNA
jgi:hypothetical protein